MDIIQIFLENVTKFINENKNLNEIIKEKEEKLLLSLTSKYLELMDISIKKMKQEIIPTINLRYSFKLYNLKLLNCFSIILV